MMKSSFSSNYKSKSESNFDSVSNQETNVSKNKDENSSPRNDLGNFSKDEIRKSEAKSTTSFMTNMLNKNSTLNSLSDDNTAFFPQSGEIFASRNDQNGFSSQRDHRASFNEDTKLYNFTGCQTSSEKIMSSRNSSKLLDQTSFDEPNNFNKVEDLINQILSPRKTLSEDIKQIDMKFNRLSLDENESVIRADSNLNSSLKQETDKKGLNYCDFDAFLKQSTYLNETLSSSKIIRNEHKFNPKNRASSMLYNNNFEPSEGRTIKVLENVYDKPNKEEMLINNPKGFQESLKNQSSQINQGYEDEQCDPVNEDQACHRFGLKNILYNSTQPVGSKNNITPTYQNSEYYDYSQQYMMPNVPINEHGFYQKKAANTAYLTDDGPYFPLDWNYSEPTMNKEDEGETNDVYSMMNESYYSQFPSMDVFNSPGPVQDGTSFKKSNYQLYSPNGASDMDKKRVNNNTSGAAKYKNHMNYDSSKITFVNQDHMQGIKSVPIYPMGRALSTNGVTTMNKPVFNDKANKLELFRANSVAFSGLSLKDIQGWIVDFSRDQHGSRFIQQKMEKSTNGVDREIVFKEITMNDNVLYSLMTDVFGNYVVQKMLEFGNEEQKREISKHLKCRVLTLTTQMYGCRVVQKAIECIPRKLQSQVIHELDGHVLDCVKDQNGNHVIQKCIEHVPADNLDFIIKEFNGKVFELSSHPYGCRVIQRLMEHCEPEQTYGLMKEIFENVPELVRDQYGNYVIQHILDHKKHQVYPSRIIQFVFDNIFKLSSHKFASNVVEKCIQFSTMTQKENLVKFILKNSDGGCNDSLYNMMKDQFANYVVQKIVDSVSGDLRKQLLLKMKPHFINLKKLTYGKHMINKVDRWLKETELINPLMRCDDDFPSLNNTTGSSGC